VQLPCRTRDSARSVSAPVEARDRSLKRATAAPAGSRHRRADRPDRFSGAAVTTIAPIDPRARFCRAGAPPVRWAPAAPS